MSPKKNKKKKNKTTGTQNKIDWLGITLIVLLGLILFYPPYFQGLFFKHHMFVTHIITGIIFILVWINKLRSREISMITSPLDWAILGYAIAYALSLITAVVFGEAVYGFLRALNYFMIYWIVTQVIKEYTGIRTLLKIIIISGLGVAMIGILAATGFIDYKNAIIGNQLASTLGYSNSLAVFLSVLFLLGVSMQINENNRYWQIFFYLANYIVMLATLLTLSKGAWVILIFGAILLIIGLPHTYRFKVLYFSGISIIAAMTVSNNVMSAIASETPSNGIWTILVGIILVIGGWIIWSLIEHWLVKIKFPRIITIAIIVIIVISAAFAFPRINLSDRVLQEALEITNFENSSYASRIEFMRCAMEIVKDYPITGAGAGGWESLYRQYQNYNYWTTETHSHILQIWVETGTFGLLAFASIWIIFFYLIYRLYIFYRCREEKEEWVLIWGISAAAMGLGLHSCFDFDLSLPALVILLWSLLALISVSYNNSISKKKKDIKPWVSVMVAGILTLIMLVAGWKYLLAYNQAQSGHRALQSSQSNNQTEVEQLNQAVTYYSKAVKNDPLNAEYWSYFASLQGYFYLLLNAQGYEQAEIYSQQSIIATKKALDLNPYDPEINDRLLQNLASIGELDGIVRVGKLYIRSLPNDPKSYVKIAQLWWGASQKCQENGQHDMAIKFAREIIELNEVLHRQISRVNTDHPLWQGEKLTVKPEVKDIYNQAWDFIKINGVNEKQY